MSTLLIYDLTFISGDRGDGGRVKIVEKSAKPVTPVLTSVI